MGISNKDGIVRDPPSFTKGSILFGGVGGAIEEDNANLFWDNVNKRLGIGTTTPEAKLDVVGDIKASGTVYGGYGGYGGLQSFVTDPTGGGIAFPHTGYNTFLIRNYQGNLYFYNNYSQSWDAFMYTVNSGKDLFISGNVGIGTYSPAQKLHVAGNIRVDGNIIPDSDNLRNIGSDTLRWALVRAVSVVTGSLNLKSEKGDWTLEEGEDGIYAFNNKTGKKYKVRLDEVN